MNQLLKVPVLLAAALTLSGCAIIHRQYVPPQSSEIAYFRVTDPQGRGLTTQTGMIATFEEGENCQGRYWMQGGPSNMEQTEVTTSFARIPAGKSFSAAIHRSLGSTSGSGYYLYCVPIMNFRPEPGRYYVAVLSTDKNSCHVSLRSAGEETMAGSRSEPFRKMLFSNGLTEDSSFCSPAQ